MAETASFPRTVLVTGANRGIGLGIVRQMLQSGATSPAAVVAGSPDFLFATHRAPLGSDTMADLESLAKEHPKLHLLKLDVKDECGIKRIADSVEKAVGELGLNLLINNSGLNDPADRHANISELDSAAMLEHLSVNTIGPVLLTQAFMPLLQRAADQNASEALGSQRAAVVYVSSRLGSVALSSEGRVEAVHNTKCRMYAYRCSKSALNMMARVMSYELQPLGILSLLIHPGWVKTGMGGANADFEVADSVRGILTQVRKLDEEHNGAFVSHTGEVLPW
ncbi:C-signal-like [Sycon ciliatum]|uniref:C-signal-like n=1 Tax=Sycon ciliatum TaxID=27933 RepID=UPI0031F6A4B6